MFAGFWNCISRKISAEKCKSPAKQLMGPYRGCKLFTYVIYIRMLFSTVSRSYVSSALHPDEAGIPHTKKEKMDEEKCQIKKKKNKLALKEKKRGEGDKESSNKQGLVFQRLYSIRYPKANPRRRKGTGKRTHRGYHSPD